MLISIIVPIYNVSKQLSRCIDSILNQEDTDFELILVNDGSTDNSEEICDIYAMNDKRVKVIHKENKGVSHSRNVGLKHANGRYVVFIDSDDYIEKSMIEKLKYIIENEQNPDWIVWGYNILNEEGVVVNKINLDNRTYNLKNKRQLYSTIESKTFGYVWTCAFKLEIIKNNAMSFNENVSLMEDLIFTYRYFQYCNRVVTTSQIKYNYIRYNGNATLSKKKNKNIFDIFLEIIECKEKVLIDLEFEKSYIDNVLFDSSLYAVKETLKTIYVIEKGFKRRLEATKRILNNNTINNLLYKNEKVVKLKKIKIIERLILDKNIFLIYCIYSIRNLKLQICKN